MELHVAGVLTALAVAGFAAPCAATAGTVAILVASVTGVTLLFIATGIPQHSTIAFVILAGAVLALTRPAWWILPPLAAGFSGVAWTSILRLQGLPWAPAVLAAGLLITAAVVLAKRRVGFTTAALRDEALLMIGVLAALVAMAPDAVGGWQSGLALTAGPLSSEGPTGGPWLALLVVGCMLLGGSYTLWKRR